MAGWHAVAGVMTGDIGGGLPLGPCRSGDEPTAGGDASAAGDAGAADGWGATVLSVECMAADGAWRRWCGTTGGTGNL